MVFSSCQCDPSFGYLYLRYLELHRTDLHVRKIAKKTINFIMCVRSSVRISRLGCPRTNFNDIYYLRIFRKFVEKIEVWLNA